MRELITDFYHGSKSKVNSPISVSMPVAFSRSSPMLLAFKEELPARPGVVRRLPQP
jgi:hypothetical protein